MGSAATRFITISIPSARIFRIGNEGGCVVIQHQGEMEGGEGDRDCSDDNYKNKC